MDNSERDIYEMASEVTGAADTLDRNGRLVAVRQDNSNSTTDSGNDSLKASDDALAFDEYDVARPVAQENPQSQPQISSQVDKKRAARTAQQEDTIATPGDGNGNGGEMGKDGVVSDSMNDITSVDNALYANVSASPAAATTKGRINEPICTSINDFTLVDNVIYNN